MMRERVTFGKGLRMTQQTVDGAAALVHLATLHWPSLGFADADLG